MPYVTPALRKSVLQEKLPISPRRKNFAVSIVASMLIVLASALSCRSPDIGSDPRGTPLHVAAYDGDEARVRALISAGADVNAKNSAGVTPLLRASQQGHLGTVKLLVEAGAEINVPSKPIGASLLDEILIEVMATIAPKGATALTAAAYGGYADIVAYLLSKGASVDPRDSMSQTPLHQAANAAVAKLLLDHGAEVDARDKYRWTPLHEAAAAGRDEVVILLLSRGAEVDAKTNVDATPLFLASYNEGTVQTITRCWIMGLTRML